MNEVWRFYGWLYLQPWNFRIKVILEKSCDMDFTKEHGWTTFRTCILRVWKRQDCLNKRRCVATLFLRSLIFSCCVPSLLRELLVEPGTVSWPACRLPCAQGLEKQQLPSGNPAAWKLLSHCAMFLAQPAICTGRRSPAEMFMVFMFSLVPGI